MFRVLALSVHDDHACAGGPRRRFVFAFAVGCMLSSAHGLLVGAWPFGIVARSGAGVAVQGWTESPGVAQDRS